MHQWIKRYGKKYAKLVADAWDNEKLYLELVQNTHAALRRARIKTPPGFTFTAVPGSCDFSWNYYANQVKLPLPPKPAGTTRTISVAGGEEPEPKTEFACLCLPEDE